ncbi:SIMPL domain-containing protein [Shewanella baltica]|uniref:SIMPL domain-containing protein n=1 Tax=Shewanella baltica TaxID=62322 RepID=UPI00217ED868|nr:SIMPL domain-containing protein [Shewanella baltica]MCS6128219.1 SIMPL domain-containing protein [Shewanella baltica]MCS6137584.1 SIMPL domain-containing protein [Shewanella baltica]MCS6146346.1 SIMPL domain-containing protein [Shewanella baltica]MCS6170876.1 SIMPL domain-containing protein [Shewanella baltica]MCS6188187.1 SIMPL domain-containing protein [Shewanella baltica]
MEKNNILPALLLGGFLCAGLVYVGQTASTALLQMKAMERTVTVKGLAEKEVKANVAIWPINFTEVDNNLPKLYETVQQKTDRVVAFLKEQGFSDSEITISLPSIEDRQAQGYVDPNVRYRYSAKVNLSVYTPQIDLMLNTRKQMISLVKEGIAIASQEYDNRTEFLFTDLNSVKPVMVQEATQNAREVAEKFAKDSDSHLGKIKTASQGQFTISDRDNSTPYIKQIRIVSTLTYYLND